MSLPYNTRKENALVVNRFNTSAYGLNSIEHEGVSLWHTLPNELRCQTDFPRFKNGVLEFLANVLVDYL